MSKAKTYCKAYGIPLIIAFYLLLLAEAPIKIIVLIVLMCADAVEGAFEGIKDGLYRWKVVLTGIRLNLFGIKNKMYKRRTKWQKENLIIRGDSDA